MRKEPHWVKLFLRELSRTGNVRMAAEAAGVDFTTAYGRRKRHAEFSERWEGALEARAANGESGHALTLPQPAAAPSLSRERERDFAVRPDGKVIKGSDARWGKRAEEAFLAELTMSANVKRAAGAAGFSAAAVYKRRIKDRHLAAAWDAAIEVGKARVQAYLVEAAGRTFDPDELPVAEGDREMEKVSISQAINIAKLKGPSTSPGSGPGLWRTNGSGSEDGDGQFVTNEEAEAARGRIFDRLQRIKEDIADQERETGCCHNCGQPLTGEPGDSLYRGPMARYLLLDGG